MLHQWLSSYQYVASNITAMPIYVIIIQGTSTRGEIYTCKKRHQIQKMQRESSLPEISDAEAWVYAGQQ